MNISDLKNVVWKEGDYFVAQSLNVDVSSFGTTRQEALKNLREALELFFEDTENVSVQSIHEPEIVSV